MRMSVALGAAASLLLLCVPTYAQSWRTSCSVDSGSIKRSGSTYTFRTSKNHCPGGIFNQRAELNTSDFSVGSKATYTFSTTLEMRAKSKEPFIVFQLHDGRNGCSPPLSVRWGSGGALSFDSDYTKGKGMAGCVENRGLRNARYQGPALKRDGTPYKFQATVQFDGKGGFDVSVTVNGKQSIGGKYAPSEDPQFVRAKRYYFKHGVYSRNIFDYELKSTGIRLSR